MVLHAFAKHLEKQSCNLLAISLERERADATLTGIANTSINPQAFKADSITNPEAKNLLIYYFKTCLVQAFFYAN
jgi:hypothetical protein